MTVDKKTKKLFKDAWGDWENVHGIYDDAIKARLQELDPEYVKELDKLVKGATFWYA